MSPAATDTLVTNVDHTFGDKVVGDMVGAEASDSCVLLKLSPSAV